VFDSCFVAVLILFGLVVTLGEPHGGQAEVATLAGGGEGSALLQMAVPRFVKDINPSTWSSNPAKLTDVDGVLFFAADGVKTTGPYTGVELWKSDGTESGTVLVKDINPGYSNSDPADFINVHGVLFFTADDGVHGRELWKSDGTPDGTVMVKDLNVGDLFNIIVMDDYLYFCAQGGLWKSDGTTTGTVKISSLFIPTTYSRDDIAMVNHRLYFHASGTSYDLELWTSDGTSGGTHLVKDINPSGSSDPRSFASFNDMFYFTADDGVHGRELWRSDGTEPGTVLVKDIHPTGGALLVCVSPTMVNNTLFFVANDGTHGYEVWKSDGTAGGTVMVKDINPATVSDQVTMPLDLVVFQGNLFFSVDDGTHGRELWMSDGTVVGTVLVRDINPTSGGVSFSPPHNLMVAGNVLYFEAADGVAGYELWRSDGTTAGTIRVKDIWAGELSGSPKEITASNGKVFFQAQDVQSGTELWCSDGTEVGTVLIKDVNSLPSSGLSVFEQPIAYKDRMVFNPEDPVHGAELWSSDGTAAGTSIIREINPGPADTPISYGVVANDLLFFFVVEDPACCFSCLNLWQTDGTSDGTFMVKDLDSPSGLIAVQDRLYFNALHNGNRWLWKSDGTEAGTIPVKQVASSAMVDFNGILFFSAPSDMHYGLWKSDGTAEGTIMVREIAEYSGLENLTTVSDTLFFRADDGSDDGHGLELWKSDGTYTGTVIVKDINPGGWNDSTPSHLTAFSGKLFFGADDGIHGEELWSSDGSPTGTLMVKDIYSGTFYSHPTELMVVGDNLFFVADDDAGAGLWVTDGIETGTMLVRPFNSTTPSPGAYPYPPHRLTALGDRLFFVADDGMHGSELWCSDGTFDGTQMLTDVDEPSYPAIFEPAGLTVVNDKLYFSLNDTEHGRELWVLDLNFVPVPTLTSPLNGTIFNTSTVTLTWRAITEPQVTGYYLSFNSKVLDVGNVTHYVTSTLPDGFYHWAVAAYDSVDSTSEYSDAWLFIVDTGSLPKVYLPLICRQ